MSQVEEQRKAVIQVVYDHFCARGIWPTFDQIDRPLRRAGIDPVRIIKEMPGMYMPPNSGRIEPASSDEIRLTIQGIALADGGMEDVDRFLRLLPWLAKMELNFEPSSTGDDQTLRVSRAEIVNFLGLDEASTVPGRVYAILKQERWGGGGSSSSGRDYTISVRRDVSRFSRVASLEDYITVLAERDRENEAPAAITRFGSLMFTKLNSAAWGGEAQPEAPAKEASDEDFVASAVVFSIKQNSIEAKFECSKLIFLIDELNRNYVERRTYATHALLRAILDHIPPILGFRTFDEVANNYSWTRTDKQYMAKLKDFRTQADDALHRTISRKIDILRFDDLPGAVGFNVLLQECADKLH